jgi:hypothetical protein
MKAALSGALHPSRSKEIVIFIFFLQISLLAHSPLQVDKVDPPPMLGVAAAYNDLACMKRLGDD